MSGKTIHTFAKWRVLPGQLDKVLENLKILHAGSITEPGNLFYTVLQDRADPDVILIYEGYCDESALEQHRNSTHYVQCVVGVIRPLLAEREVIIMSPLEI